MSKIVLRGKEYSLKELLALINQILIIVERGNDAEVRRKKDGTIVVYEIKKSVCCESPSVANII